MAITRGRLIRNTSKAAATEVPIDPARATRQPGGEWAHGRRVEKDIVDATLLAKEIIARAERDRDAIVSEARKIAIHEAENAAREAERTEQAKVAALYLSVKRAEETQVERALDRSVSIAVLLAERLLGEALTEKPERITAMARQVLAEARGARRLTMEAHPNDAPELRRNMADFGLPSESIDVQENREFQRGELRLHTDLGTIDAKLTPQLERLARALKDTLR